VRASDSIAAATRVAQSYLDLTAISQIAEKAAQTPVTCAPETGHVLACDASAVAPEFSGPQRPRVGVIKDSAFQFYYPENIDALAAAGAHIVPISPLAAEGLPEVDAIYIGGGFPETHAKALSENQKFRDTVKSAAAEGMPIYAECGGLIYLGEALVMEQSYPMTGVLPIVFGFSQRPQGHGYTKVSVDRDNPYFTVGSRLKGHEFHYSSVLQYNGTDADLVFSMQKGRGIIDSKDGLCVGNVLATYTHLHALGCPQWAASIVRLAAAHMSAQSAS
ncbi:MAG: cobyrinate a,c-diamide synthase, partial [Thermodesulfobacteriota bacterium]